jgi:hypothetical protein
LAYAREVTRSKWTHGYPMPGRPSNSPSGSAAIRLASALSTVS